MNTDVGIKGQSLLTLNDITDEQMGGLLDLADALKARRSGGQAEPLLRGSVIAALFQKASTRTRCAISVALLEEGGHAESLSTGEIHLGKKESVADTARVLGRLFDGIMFRGYKQETLQIIASHAGVPVWNALTDEWHPTQALADLMTVRECFGQLQGLKFVYVGDGRNNVANSLMIGCAKAGMNFVTCAPSSLCPAEPVLESAQDICGRTGGSVAVLDDPSSAVQGANVVCTDVWVSMGEEAKRDERIGLLRPYQVNMDLIRGTGNLESNRVIFLHCLPALHDHHTELTKQLGAMEVTDDVFNAPFSKVFDEAENRMHTIKAILVATLT